MKAKTLCLLAGITTPLILTGSVQAGFLGIKRIGEHARESRGTTK